MKHFLLLLSLILFICSCEKEPPAKVHGVDFLLKTYKVYYDFHQVAEEYDSLYFVEADVRPNSSYKLRVEGNACFYVDVYHIYGDGVGYWERRMSHEITVHSGWTFGVPDTIWPIIEAPPIPTWIDMDSLFQIQLISEGIDYTRELNWW